MATIEHDAARWGWARADDADRSRLVRVGDLVDALAKVEERAPLVAAGIVLDRLAGAALYELRKNGDASPVTAAYRFEKDGCGFWIEGAEGFMGFSHGDPSEAFLGVCGAHAILRRCLCVGLPSAQGIAAYLAVQEAIAAAAFPEFDWGSASRPQSAAVEAVPLSIVAAASPAPVQAPTVREPEGGSWPHKKGDDWRDEEREALFLMRHVDKRKGDDLAQIAGVSRQRINELIGASNVKAENLHTIESKDARKWKPSAALLKQCGAPCSPLQNTAEQLCAA